MRLFFAVELPEPVREQLYALQDEMRANLPVDAIRLVKHEQLHVTLAFLGEVPEEKLEEVKETANALCLDSPGSKLKFEGLGAFPNWRSPHVIWVGVKENDLKPHDKNGPLTALGTLLTTKCAALTGSAPENKVLLHVTLARSSKRLSHNTAREVSRYLKALPEPNFGTASISEVVLFQSTLSSSGSRHDPIAHFNLA